MKPLVEPEKADQKLTETFASSVIDSLAMPILLSSSSADVDECPLKVNIACCVETPAVAPDWRPASSAVAVATASEIVSVDVSAVELSLEVFARCFADLAELSGSTAVEIEPSTLVILVVEIVDKPVASAALVGKFRLSVRPS